MNKKAREDRRDKGRYYSESEILKGERSIWIKIRGIATKIFDMMSVEQIN